MRAVTREAGGKFPVDESSNREAGRKFSVDESSNKGGRKEVSCG